jgi:hypothetical protein
MFTGRSTRQIIVTVLKDFSWCDDRVDAIAFDQILLMRRDEEDEDGGLRFAFVLAHSRLAISCSLMSLHSQPRGLTVRIIRRSRIIIANSKRARWAFLFPLFLSPSSFGAL